jgi:hypothetical protein
LPAATTLTEQVLAIQRRLVMRNRSSEKRWTGISWREQFWSKHLATAVEELLREVEGRPLFLLMADENPACDAFLRGRNVPQAHLCFFSWSWRLLLVSALSEWINAGKQEPE